MIVVTPRRPSSCRRFVGRAVLSGIATALLPPDRIPPVARQLVHVGLGLAAATATVSAPERQEPTGPGQPPDAVRPMPQEAVPMRTRVALGMMMGSLAAVCSAVGMRMDTAAEQALVRRGVRRPRLWIGIAATALAATMSWVDARRDDAAKSRAGPVGGS